MSCPKNIIEKKFLWHKYKTEGSHEFQISWIEEWLGGTRFSVHEICKYCMCRKSYNLEDEELIRILGFRPSNNGYPLRNIYRDELEEQAKKHGLTLNR